MSGEARHPVAWATLVDYWMGELPTDVQDALEEHLMGCQACSEQSGRVAELTRALGSLIPALLSENALAALSSRGLRVVENRMLPGERREVVFPKDADILLHRLTGLSLSDATHVRFVLRVEGTEQVLVAIDDAICERTQGEVLVACQQHFATLPPDTVAEVWIRDAAGNEKVSTFTILHRFS